EPAEQHEQHAVEQVADGVQRELALLRASPRQSLGHFVMVDDIEGAEGEVDDDQRPEDGGGHGSASRNTAPWWISIPKRGWMTSSVKLNLPSPSSVCVTASAPGVSQRDSVKRRPKSWRK